MENFHTEILTLLSLMKKYLIHLWVNYSHIISFTRAAVKAADNPKREVQDPPEQKKFPVQLYLLGNVRKVLKFYGLLTFWSPLNSYVGL